MSTREALSFCRLCMGHCGVVVTLDAELRETIPLERLADATAWRDRRMMALAAHKQAQDKKKPR